MTTHLCKFYEIPSMQCKKILTLGSSEDLVCNSNGHCNYPFQMIPKKYTCKYFEKYEKKDPLPDNSSPVLRWRGD